MESNSTKYTIKLSLMKFFWLMFISAMALSATIAKSDTYNIGLKPTSHTPNNFVSWHDLRSNFKKGSFKGGDILLVEDGYFDKLELNNLKFVPSLKIRAKNQHKAQLSTISVKNSSGIIIDGFSVSPSYGKEYRKTKIILVGPNSSNITFSSMEIFSVRSPDAWKPEDWSKKASDGIRTLGSDITVRDNQLFNIGNGITILSPKSSAINNHISEFAKDGLRILADDVVAKGNTIQNCLSIDKNHDDAIQSWSYGKNGKVGRGVIKNVQLTGNLIIQKNNPATNIPCRMQGIGLFDGMYENWNIENNIVVVDHWHGITVMGATSVRIVNNTVVDPNDNKPGPANIKIFNHKNGQKSSGNVVANNISAGYGKKDAGTLYTKNITLTNRYTMFKDFDALNLRLTTSSPARNASHQLLVPKTDFFGNTRRSPSDAGAIETTKEN